MRVRFLLLNYWKFNMEENPFEPPKVTEENVNIEELIKNASSTVNSFMFNQIYREGKFQRIDHWNSLENTALIIEGSYSLQYGVGEENMFSIHFSFVFNGTKFRFFKAKKVTLLIRVFSILSRDTSKRLKIKNIKTFKFSNINELGVQLEGFKDEMKKRIKEIIVVMTKKYERDLEEEHKWRR